MKYIFHIHSQINVLVASLIVKHENYKREDVLFLCFREVFPPEELGNICIMLDKCYYHKYNSIRYFYKFHFLRNNKQISYIDEIINTFIKKESFTYYVPHCKNPLYSVIINHNQCEQVHYIEDGADNYLSLNSLTVKFPLSIHWGHRLFSSVFKFIPAIHVDRIVQYTNLYTDIGKSISKCYTINEQGFQQGLNQNVRVLPLEQNIINLFQTSINYLNAFVFDAVVEQKVMSEKTLFSFFLRFIKDNPNFINEGISIKFHPAQGDSSKSLIVDILKEQVVPFEILSPDVNFEVFLTSNNSIKIFGIGSSLLKYSKIYNPKLTYPLYNHINREDILDRKRLVTWDNMFKQTLK